MTLSYQQLINIHLLEALISQVNLKVPYNSTERDLTLSVPINVFKSIPPTPDKFSLPQPHWL